ncbi:hypothetical protein [uncultured Methanobrevibacter sp.]|uniref:hypothetical protein n=1 Tax=uncultured Methanobrevibacter sp. TaxID=253161 RepID=UPI002621922A|nr:hypothetical protein [uncultured Methanobrevibacter sp.]
MEECGQALTLLNNAIILYPDNDYFLSLKADVFIHYEEYGRAVECFEQILEMGISDEDTLNFIKREFRTCLSLRIDQLIEREKYADAWQCYRRMLEIESVNLKRPAMIGRFKKHVKEYSSQVKYRQYYVKISSDEAKLKLTEFLKENGFKSSFESGLLFLIDVVDKTYNSVSVDKVGDRDIISESKFYDKVNYYPRDQIVHRQLHDEDGNLVYEGYTLNYSPYGFGKAYFADGTLYREGIFDIKGIVQGKEYYPSGRLRFEGQWALTRGYGPNAPWNGNAYSENGEMIYSGKFEIKRGGVGWPMIQNPKGFPLEQKERPKIDYY